MRTSQRLGLPVRVLQGCRRSGPRLEYAPSVGIRYDGLYKISAVVQAGNDLVTYILQRLEYQTPLDESISA